jgi:hypothetical protein
MLDDLLRPGGHPPEFFGNNALLGDRRFLKTALELIHLFAPMPPPLDLLLAIADSTHVRNSLQERINRTQPSREQVFVAIDGALVNRYRKLVVVQFGPL